MRRTRQKSIVLTICLSLLLSLFPGSSLAAKKEAKVKKVEVCTTDSGVLVMKKKERQTLKLAINGTYSKQAWKKLTFLSKNKKVVKTNKLGKLTAKKKGTTQITIRAKKGKAKTSLKVIVGTKIQSVRLNAAAQELLVGDSVQLTASVTPKKASYKKLRWTSSNPAAVVVVNGKVNAVAEGTATITAAALDGTKKEAVCQIVVRKPEGSTQTPKASDDPQTTPAAPVPAGGMAYNNSYRNLFMELGRTEKEIDAKVEEAWQKFFYGTEEERIYYPVEPDMAYIYTADTDDVRSEGMSYGMMICVQMDKQEEFDRLWKWAVTYMRHSSGEFKDYFAWKCSAGGSKMDDTPAPDGEEYFATALLFASARWGDREGIYDYGGEAQKLLDAMRYHDNGRGAVNSIFNAEHKMPVFCPIGSAMDHTDPSYHLPAFYEVWALYDEEHSDFWIGAAQASRQHFKDTTNKTTGLGPDYADYDGSATGGNHADFRFDAWRIAANIACDYAWWGRDSWATTHADRIQSFFAKQGVEDYGNQWSLDGKMLDKDHSPGLVAMNATAGLAASNKQAWAFLEDFWNISPTTGKYRYYDGCLYMMGLLHCSGKFRAYLPNGTKPAMVTGSESIVSLWKQEQQQFVLDSVWAERLKLQWSKFTER